AKQTVARPVPPVVIARWHFDGKEYQSQLLVDTNLAPHSCGARVLGGTFIPGLETEFTPFWNRVENPQPLTGADIECPNVTFHIRFALRDCSRSVRGTNNDNVAGHDRRCIQSDLSAQGVNLLIVTFLQIDDSVFTEAGDSASRLCIQCDQAIAGSDVEDPL